VRQFIENIKKQIRRGKRWVKNTRSIRWMRSLSPKERGVKIYRGRRVFTIRQLCKLLAIKVPKKYRRIANHYVTQTPIFQKLENCEKIRSKIQWIEDAENKYSLTNDKLAERTRLQAVGFERRYRSHNFDRHSDADLLCKFTEFKYQFSPLGYNAENYFTLRLYEKSVDVAVETLVTSKEMIKFRNYREKAFIKYIVSKILFVKKFQAFVKRDWIYPKESTCEEFCQFCQLQEKIIIKPVSSTQGRGIYIIESPHAQKKQEILFNELRKESVLVEQIVEQHPLLAEFNDTSLNTVRVHTIRQPSGQTDAVAAYIRFGRKGNIVDNFHASGVAAPIDLSTGRIDYGASDSFGDYHDCHPDSKLKFIGFQLPCWEQVVQTAAAAAQELPQVHHVGWDIAITKDNDVEIIEGNSSPCVSNALQTVDAHRGNIKKIYQKYFDLFAEASSEKK